MGFPRQEYWSGLPFPSPGDLPDPGCQPVSPPWQADSLPLSHWEASEAVSRGYSSLCCPGCSRQWSLLLWSTGSRVTGFSRFSSQAPEHGLSSCPTACGIFPDQGSHRCPLHLQRRFLTTGPLGKLSKYFSTSGSTEKAMAPHSSTLAWKIPWMEEPGRLQSMRSHRVGHNWMTSLSLFTLMHWRRKWQPTPVFLPGESQGRGSLEGCHLWGSTESDTTEAT